MLMTDADRFVVDFWSDVITIAFFVFLGFLVVSAILSGFFSDFIEGLEGKKGRRRG